MADDGDERAQRREARRRVRAAVDDAFARKGLPARRWPADWPALAPPPPPPPLTPGETRKTWLATIEVGRDEVLALPAGVAIEDAADVILEASFQAALEHQRRSEKPEPPPPPPVLRDIIWPR